MEVDRPGDSASIEAPPLWGLTLVLAEIAERLVRAQRTPPSEPDDSPVPEGDAEVAA